MQWDACPQRGVLAARIGGFLERLLEHVCCFWYSGDWGLVAARKVDAGEEGV